MSEYCHHCGTTISEDIATLCPLCASKPATLRREEIEAWAQYKRKGLSEMRAYVPGEDLSAVSVAAVDTPEEGGMIARNPKNHDDQWYVAKAYFEDNLEPA